MGSGDPGRRSRGRDLALGEGSGASASPPRRAVGAANAARIDGQDAHHTPCRAPLRGMIPPAPLAPGSSSASGSDGFLRSIRLSADGTAEDRRPVTAGIDPGIDGDPDGDPDPDSDPGAECSRSASGVDDNDPRGGRCLSQLDIRVCSERLQPPRARRPAGCPGSPPQPSGSRGATRPNKTGPAATGAAQRTALAITRST